MHFLEPGSSPSTLGNIFSPPSFFHKVVPSMDRQTIQAGNTNFCWNRLQTIKMDEAEDPGISYQEGY